MLVQALAEYADRHLAEELNDAAWEMKPVPWILEISRQGKFHNITPHMKPATRGNKQVEVPREMIVPRSPVARNSGEHPLLASDDIAYVLGAGPWTPQKEEDRNKAGRHHEAFVALIGKAADETGDPALDSCVRFFGDPCEVEKARKALGMAKAGQIVALSVEEPLVERESVREFWRKHYEAKLAGRVEGSNDECMISGKMGPIAPTHDKIKGTSNLGGQASGVALMSFDKDAFCSYGWEQNRNSPVSPDRALAYVLAFNRLLKTENRQRKDIAGLGFLYWLRESSEFDAMNLLERADPAQVHKLLSFDPLHTDLDANRFYMVAVSGNGGRLRVHCWADIALPKVKANVRDWHRQLQMEYPRYEGEDPAPVRLWQVLYALDRDGKPDDHTVVALLRRGIEGLPLGYSVLAKALVRLRHQGEGEPGGTGKPAARKSDPMSLARLRVPMGLIRMCLNDLFRRKEGAPQMSEGLDPVCTIPAYVCGRLMAEFENLQRASSQSDVNSSVLDRYFGLASTYPAVAFPKIENLAQKHLRKLRRDNPPAAYAIDARLQDLHNLLQPSESGAYPGKLGLEGQGLFALGYYHQKARSRVQAQDHKQANDAANPSQEIDQESKR